jgi:hypothetical protein
MNRERSAEKLNSLSEEDLEWLEAKAREVRESRKQKTRDYTLRMKPKRQDPEAVALSRPKPRAEAGFESRSYADVSAASLHTFFRESYSKHHPGHTPEEDEWEQS